jgi:hypothetical protein
MHSTPCLLVRCSQELSLVLEDDADAFIEELWKNLAKEIINANDSL